VLATVFWDPSRACCCRIFWNMDAKLTPTGTAPRWKACERLSRENGLLFLTVLWFSPMKVRSYTTEQNRNLLQNFGWETLDHHPFSSTLAHSDFSLFRALNVHLSGNCFTRYEDVKRVTICWLNQQGRTFHVSGMETLQHAVTSVSIVKGTVLKNSVTVTP
jgi:hypothetical protein